MKRGSLKSRRKAVQWVREGLDLIDAERRDKQLRDLSKKVPLTANNSA